MSSLKVLSHPEFGSLECVNLKGQYCFVANDVCNVLGLKNTSDRLKSLDEDEKLTYVLNRAGQRREVNMINESGLYHLVMISRKPEAKAFRKWVTSEVLPSIRQNGFYVHPSVALSKAQCKKMDDQMRGLMKEFLTDRDLMRCARATGNAFRYVQRLLDGWGNNPGVMDDLQRRALENKEREVESPCSVERMRDVIEALSK